jgi:DNA-binding transcriptional regulator YiaG
MTTTTTAADEYQQWRNRNPLKTWRNTSDVTLMRLAGDAQVSISTIQLWETGARTPKPAQFAILARITGHSHIAGAWRRWLNERPRPAAAPKKTK